jgi:acetyl-CoA carboxylase biotin carboxyl carrier protein
MRVMRPKTDRPAARSRARDLAAPDTSATSSAAGGAPLPGEGAGTLDLRLIRELAKVVSQYQLSELALEIGGGRVRLRRGGAGAAPAAAAPVAAAAAPVPAAAPAAPAAPAPAPAAPTDVVEITSPFVGTFYRAPNPDASPYVEVGARVRKGQVLCIVEAMKLMNEIESEVDGTVLEVLAQNGRPVEYGEPLFTVKVG